MNNIQSVEAEKRGFWQVLSSCSGTAKDQKNRFRFVAWTFAWAVTFVAMSRLLESDYQLATPFAWLAAAVPNVFGAMVVLSYLRFLHGADEFVQKLQYEGLATGFGLSIVVAMGYQLFLHVGAPQMESDDFVLLMAIGWIIGQIYAVWKYR